LSFSISIYDQVIYIVSNASGRRWSSTDIRHINLRPAPRCHCEFRSAPAGRLPYVRPCLDQSTCSRKHRFRSVNNLGQVQYRFSVSSRVNSRTQPNSSKVCVNFTTSKSAILVVRLSQRCKRGGDRTGHRRVIVAPNNYLSSRSLGIELCAFLLLQKLIIRLIQFHRISYTAST
jgi:hypothetical protein